MIFMTNEDNQAFQFLMISVKKKRLDAQNYECAFSEFKLADAINPNNREVNQLF